MSPSPNPWHWILDDRTLAPNEKLVALAIVRHMNAQGTCRVGTKRLVALSGLRKRSVLRAIAGLRRLPWFRVKRTGRSSIFELNQRQANLFSNAHEGLWKTLSKSGENPVDMVFARCHTGTSEVPHRHLHRSRAFEAGKSTSAAAPRAARHDQPHAPLAGDVGGPRTSPEENVEGPPKATVSGAWGRATKERNDDARLEWEQRQTKRLLRIERDEELRRELAVGSGPEI